MNIIPFHEEDSSGHLNDQSHIGPVVVDSNNVKSSSFLPVNCCKPCDNDQIIKTEQQQQQGSSSSCRAVVGREKGMLRRMACKARTIPDGHNTSTAYFDIPNDAPHGMLLVCSHFSCAVSGSRFRYCAVCDIPVAKRNFPRRHSHGMWPPPGGECTLVKQEQEKESIEIDNDDDDDDDDNDNDSVSYVLGLTSSSQSKKKRLLDDSDVSLPQQQQRQRQRQRREVPAFVVAPPVLHKTTTAVGGAATDKKNLEIFQPISPHSSSSSAANTTNNCNSMSCEMLLPQKYLPPSPLYSAPMDHHHHSMQQQQQRHYHLPPPPTISMELNARELAWLRLLHCRPQQQQQQQQQKPGNYGMDEWMESVLQVSSLPAAAAALVSENTTLLFHDNNNNNNNNHHQHHHYSNTNSTCNNDWDMDGVLHAAEIMVSESSSSSSTALLCNSNNDWDCNNNSSTSTSNHQHHSRCMPYIPAVV